MIGYVLLAVHILIVLIAFFLKRKGIMKIDHLMMVIILCIPFWGMLSAVMISIMIRFNRVGRNSKDLEVMHGNTESEGSLLVEAPESANVVPLEDALRVEFYSKQIKYGIRIFDHIAEVETINQSDQYPQDQSH